MNDERLEIRMTKHGRGEVFINGRKVEGVRRLTFAAGFDEPNTLTLETTAPHAATIEGPGLVYVQHGKYPKLLRHAMDLYTYRQDRLARGLNVR